MESFGSGMKKSFSENKFDMKKKNESEILWYMYQWINRKANNGISKWEAG